MKRVVLFIGCIAMFVGAKAEERTPRQVLQIAEDFVQQRHMQESRSSLKRTVGTIIEPQIVRKTPAYYAVNNASGFVLVGTEQHFPAILGYTDDGTPFCYDSLPDNLKYWLACYEQQAEEMKADNQLQPHKTPAATESVVYVGPLITATWNQNSPYNNLAPVYQGTSHAATGCVATAAAQIMYYWKYPERGTGQHSYTWTNSFDNTKNTLSVDFSSAVYDWAKMKDNITNASAQETKDAVATLMYHVGVSCDMNYASDRTSSSGAVPTNMATALKNYFGYDANLQNRVYRSNYSSDDFEQLLRDEIDAGRPVFYSGWGDVNEETGKRPGHSFICDGYSSDGLFHINWGWGGSANGYFISSLMNYSNPGNGATTGIYYANQEIMAGVQPPMQYHILRMDSLTCSVASTTRNGKFSVLFHNLKNLEWGSFSGTLGVALYDEEGNNRLAILSSSSQNIAAKGTVNKTFSNLTIPASYSEGYYQLVAVYKDTDGVWRPVSAKGDNFRMVQLTASSVEFYSDNTEPVLTLESQITFDNNDAVSHQGAVLSYRIRNTGGTFRGDVQAFIYKGKLARGEFGNMISRKIKRNSTEDFAVVDNLSNDPGTYNIILKYRLSESDNWTDFTPSEYAKVSITLLDDQLPSLQMADPVAFPNPTGVPYKNATLLFNIANTGGPFNGTIAAFLYENGNNKGQVDTPKQISMSKNTSLQDTIFLNFDTILSDKISYKLIVYSKSEESDIWEDIPLAAYATTTFRFMEKINTCQDVYDTICAGESVEFQKTIYSQTGDYIWKGTAQSGCDSVITLHLTVLEPQTQNLTLTITEADLPWTDGVVTIPADFIEDTYIETVPSPTGSCVTLNYNIKIDRPSDPTSMENPASPSIQVFKQDKGSTLLLQSETPLNQVSAYSADGRLLQTLKDIDEQTTISLPSSGVYFVRCLTNNQPLIIKIVVP